MHEIALCWHCFGFVAPCTRPARDNDVRPIHMGTPQLTKVILSSMFDQPTQPLTILIVDDDARIRRALARCLELDGHIVGIAESGAQAISQAGVRPWDLLCLDAQL